MSLIDVVKADAEAFLELTDKEESNRDVFERLRYLCRREFPKETHFLCLDKGMIIAVGSTEKNPYNQDEIWLKHISVDDRFKKRGYGTAILREIMRDVAESGKILAPSSFTVEGYKALGHVYPALHREFPSLRIRFGDSSSPVDGARPYRLTDPGSKEFYKTGPVLTEPQLH